MSRQRDLFEVRISIKKKSHPHYVYGLGDKHHPAKRDYDATGCIIQDEETVVRFISARNHSKAFEEGKKYGRVISVRKPHYAPILNKIEELDLTEDKNNGHSHLGVLSLDEMIWKKHENEKEKHVQRRENIFKDKVKIPIDN